MMGAMTLTIVGQLATVRGDVQKWDRAGQPHPFTMQSTSYLRRQASDIPVYFNHDTTWRLGTVTYLERSRSTGLLAVARLDADVGDLLADHQWHLSDGVIGLPAGPLRFGQIKIREVSLVGQTATLATKPLCWSRSDGAPGHLPLLWHGTWKRAQEAMVGSAYRRRADHTVIFDVDPLSVADEVLTDPVAARQRMAARPPAPAPSNPLKAAPAAVKPRSHPVRRQALADPFNPVLWDVLEYV
jgi:hypothetical protein